MGGGKSSDDHLNSEPLPSPSSSSSSSSSSSEFEDSSISSLKTYLELLGSYESPSERTLTLDQYKDAILRHKPGDWIGCTGGLEVEDYEVPEVTSLLLVGPRGSGKSALVNRIVRVFEEDKFAPDLAQESNNSLKTDGSCFLQEYSIPRSSKSLCIYDSRSFSMSKSENWAMIRSWMMEGVSHGQIVFRDSDTDLVKAGIINKRRCQYDTFPCQKRSVNFVIFVADAVSIIKSMNGKDPEYTEMLFKTYSYPYLSFRDTKPAVVITHGDELSLPERARARIHLGEILGIPPKQIFDIPDSSDNHTELAILDMLRYSIEHADRNLPYRKNGIIQIHRFFRRQLAKIRFDDWVMISEFLVVYVCLIFILSRLVSWLTNK